MVIIAEIGSLIKIIGSVFAYILFLPINFLDRLFISKILYENSFSKAIAFFVVLFILLAALGLILKSVTLIMKIGIVLFVIYSLSNYFVGLLIFVLILYLLGQFMIRSMQIKT